MKKIFLTFFLPSLTSFLLLFILNIFLHKLNCWIYYDGCSLFEDGRNYHLISFLFFFMLSLPLSFIIGLIYWWMSKRKRAKDLPI